MATEMPLLARRSLLLLMLQNRQASGLLADVATCVGSYASNQHR